MQHMQQNVTDFQVVQAKSAELLHGYWRRGGR